jgi:hypothetical protein
MIMLPNIWNYFQSTVSIKKIATLPESSQRVIDWLWMSMPEHSLNVENYVEKFLNPWHEAEDARGKSPWKSSLKKHQRLSLQL